MVRILLLPLIAVSLTAATKPAEPFLAALPPLQGIAVDMQGAPFVSTGADGKVLRILAHKQSLPLAETKGSPAGLACGRDGAIYVADRGRKSVLRLAPGGKVRVVADGFSDPVSLAVGPDGDLYVADRGASKVWRIQGSGKTEWASGLQDVRGIAVSGKGRLFASTAGKRVLRLDAAHQPPSVFAAFSDAGETAALTLDEQGDLYVARDGGGAVSVLSPQGRLLATLSIPRPRVTGLAFGGLDLQTLFVTEASGALYETRPLHRSQRLPWEPNQPLRILDPPDGAILNRHDGQAVPDGLRIVVTGTSALAGPVLVNGVAAAVRDGRFSVPVTLAARENRLVAASGPQRDSVTVLWDRDSYPRYRFSVDDNILWLKDIALHSADYRSIFDNAFLAFWRKMHDQYGAKIHFNIYYETPGFNLSQMPVKFRSEWERNSNWMRLTFHARANDPDYPYIDATPEHVVRDYRLVTGEIARFAGPKLLSPVTTLHWGELPAVAAQALRAEGVRTFVAPFDSVDGIPFTCMSLKLAQHAYAARHDYWKDTRQDIFYVRHDMVVNNVALEQIVPSLEKIAADPHQSEIIELVIHEQYFYPDYVNYEPDYRARCERAIQWVANRGYQPVFYEDGFLGAEEKHKR